MTVWHAEDPEARSDHRHVRAHLRFGSVNEQDRPVTTREWAVWCSLRDAVQGIERAIAAPPELRYAVVLIVSDNRLGSRDLAQARRVLGYVPLDRAGDHRQEDRA